jgi:hypothetical protein
VKAVERASNQVTVALHDLTIAIEKASRVLDTRLTRIEQSLDQIGYELGKRSAERLKRKLRAKVRK